MRDGRTSRVEELFARAVELPADEREELLARECGGDAALREEIASLLVYADGDTQLRAPVAAAASAFVAAAPATVGERLGPYRLIERLGEGGMGTVFLAERDDAEYRRRVAIKVLRNGLGSPEAVARFRDERQILAHLDHPSIVRLLDGGTTAQGLPYLVMEHVDGAPLAAYARGLAVPAKVALVRTICAAIQHAHQQLVVHRDIKPANVLVDVAGTPKLLDFGIAKLLDDGATREAQTRTGAALLTVEYASPEQARGEPVTVATDVYALGAVLYELLVGVPPQRPAAGVLETLRAICEDEPVRPSLAAPPAVRDELAGDLDNIIGKALAKAPAARYPSAAAFADDLDRYLDGRPVTARAATVAYRAGKFIGRHRGKLALAGLVVAALATATVVSVVQARRARAHAAVAQAQTRVAAEQTRNLLVELGVRELDAGRASRALPYFAEVLRQGEDSPAIRVLVARALAPLENQLGDAAVIAQGIIDAKWTPDGRHVVATSFDGTHVFDAALRELAHVDDPTSHLAVAGDGRRYFLWNRDGFASRPLDGQALTPTLPYRADGAAASFSAGGGLAVASTTAGDVRVWDGATGAVRFDRNLPGVIGATLDGRDRLYAGRADGGIERYALDRRDHARSAPSEPRPSPVVRLAASDDGRVITGHADGSVRHWDGATLRALTTFTGHASEIRAMAIDPAGRHLATGDAMGITQVWDLEAGRLVATLATHGYGVRAVAISPDGARVATTGGDNTFRVSNAHTGDLEMLIESFSAAGDAPGAVGGALAASFSPDGTRLLTTSGTDLKLWRVTRDPVVAEVARPFLLWSARWSPDQRWIAVAGLGALIIDASTCAVVTTLTTEGARLGDISWSPDGRYVIAVGSGGFAAIYAADGTLARRITDHVGTIYGASYDPTGGRLVTCGDDSRVVIRDASTGAPLRVLRHPARALSARWSADGAWVVTAGWDRALRVWDASTGALRSQITGGTTQFLCATMSPDGRTIASGGHDGEVTLWRADTGDRIRSLEGHTGPATSVEWSPDGELLATSGDDGTSRIWDPRTGRVLAILGHTGGHMQVSWSRDGEQVLTVNHDRGLRTWAVRRERRPVAAILAASERLSPWRLVGTHLIRAR
ncbi:MAG: protein kinase [Myxococcales bacterium]|nr:protein kinase [Myxococcales bacterium]